SSLLPRVSCVLFSGARRFFFQTGNALSPRQFGLDLRPNRAAVTEHDHEMKHQVRRLAHQVFASLVARFARGLDHFGRFLGYFFTDFGDPAVEQTRGVRTLGHARPAVFDDPHKSGQNRLFITHRIAPSQNADRSSKYAVKDVFHASRREWTLPRPPALVEG